MKVDLVITGDAELNKKLAALTGPEAKKVIRKAAREALRPVLRHARANAPKRTRRLEKSLKIRALKRSRSRIGAKVQTAAGDFKGKTFYGAFQEYDHRRGKRTNAQKRKGQPADSVADKRPVVQGKYYMKRAAEQGKQEALATYRTVVREGILALVK